MAVLRLLALAAVGVLLLTGIAAASSQADVTLAMRQYTNENKIRVFVWHGQIASGAAGEEVEVLGRDCLTKNFRLYAGTQSNPGGGYEVESAQRTTPYNIVDVNSGTTFRARWRGRLSNPILHREPLNSFWVDRVPKKPGAWKVNVNPVPIYMSLKGRFVELQRKRAGKWEPFQRAKLVHKPNYDYGGATNYEAVFTVSTRGLTLRGRIPAKTAAPCYLPFTTKPWRS
jgi:hypothetical protein